MTGNESALRSKSFLQNIYDRDMSRRMRDEYRERVAVYQRAAEDPLHPATMGNMQRYMDGQRDMAQWAVREVGKDQLHDFIDRFRNSDRRDSDENYRAKNSSLSRKEELDRRNRLGLNTSDEISDDDVPTKVKTRMNPLKAYGAITLQNKYVTTMVEGGARSGQSVAVELNREFHAISLYSHVRYGVDEALLSLNISKKITKEISLDLDSQHWTGVRLSDQGERYRESARLNYTLGF